MAVLSTAANTCGDGGTRHFLSGVVLAVAIPCSAQLGVILAILPCRDGAEGLADDIQHGFGIEVPDHHQCHVARHIVGPECLDDVIPGNASGGLVLVTDIIAAGKHLPQRHVGRTPADTLAPHPLLDCGWPAAGLALDYAATGFHVIARQQRVGHDLVQHLQAKHGIPGVDVQRIDRLLRVGIGIPVTAMLLDQFIEFGLAVAGGTGKQQVLQEMRCLLPAAAIVVLPHTDDNAECHRVRTPARLEDHPQAVLQYPVLDVIQSGRAVFTCHGATSQQEKTGKTLKKAPE